MRIKLNINKLFEIIPNWYTVEYQKLYILTNNKPIEFIQLLKEICTKLDISYSNWLDIGCGNGTLVYLLNQRGIPTLGIDVEFKPGEYVSELLISKKIKQIKSPNDKRNSIINEQGI